MTQKKKGFHYEFIFGLIIIVGILMVISFSVIRKTVEPADPFPELRILLKDDLPLTDVERDTYVDATASILNSKDYSLTDVELEFKGRGNSSWIFDKKSYKLKFAEKQNLFGIMEEGQSSKHWVLVSNYYDPTLSKNNLAYTLANNVFTNIKYTSGYQNVDLYVNDEYIGVYAIHESIRVEEGRVDIESTYDSVDTGYLLEYDMLVEGKNGIDYFRVDGLPYPFRIDSPSPEKYEDEEKFRQQVDYINGYMQNVWDAIEAHNYQEICEQVDIDTAVDVYLINELFKNSDVGLSSLYMYKESGGKLCFGPIWDFDKTCEKCLQDGSYTGLLVGVEFDQGEKKLRTSNPVFYKLMENPEFAELVRNRWKEISKTLIKEIRKFVKETLQNEQAFSYNFEVWKDCSDVPFKQSITNLRDWLINRIDWLTENGWK